MLTTIAQLRDWTARRRAESLRIGLVPTMGALHDGHLSLVRASLARCDATLVSIFVNPTQFAPNEDFKRYPRPLEDDLALLARCGEVAVFAPSVEEMYPAGFDTTVHVGGVSEPFEGSSRPGHFDGVATVVLKLLLASGADAVFFGQKDFQQVCVVRKMVADLNVPIELVVCPIVREPDGLAMSSRNRYLSGPERAQAGSLYRALCEAERLIVEEKVRDVATILDTVRATIGRAPDLRLEYAALADPVTLRDRTTLDAAMAPRVVLLLAARLGTTRLIDNALIEIAHAP